MAWQEEFAAQDAYLEAEAERRYAEIEDDADGIEIIDVRDPVLSRWHALFIGKGEDDIPF